MIANNVIVLRRSAARQAWAVRAGAALAAFSRAFAEAVRCAATRRYLADMDERMLSDIGISRAQAQFEAARPVWDVSRRR